MGHMGTHAASVGLYPNLAYNPEADFEPIGLAAGTPILILSRKDFPPKDLKEFVAYVKANGDKLNEGHAGVGSVSFTTCTLLNSMLGVNPTLIPYTGTGPSMNALVAGQVDYMCDQIVNAVPQVLGGTIKAYAIATPERNPSLPNVPTTVEAGLPEFQVSAWNALFAPKGTPQPIIDKLRAALGKALDDETTRKRLLDLGSDIPAESAARRRRSGRWSRARSRAGLRSSRRPPPELSEPATTAHPDWVESGCAVILALAHILFGKPVATPHQVRGRHFMGMR